MKHAGESSAPCGLALSRDSKRDVGASAVCGISVEGAAEASRSPNQARRPPESVLPRLTPLALTRVAFRLRSQREREPSGQIFGSSATLGREGRTDGRRGGEAGRGEGVRDTQP